MKAEEIKNELVKMGCGNYFYDIKKQVEQMLVCENKKLNLINKRRIENGFNPIDTTNEIILLTKLNNNL